MKRSTKTLLVYGAIGGLVALVLYDNMASADVPFDAMKIKPIPGVTTLTFPSPTNGKVGVILPAGSKGWIAAHRAKVLGTSPIVLALPAGTAPLVLDNIAAGDVLAIQWTDANGATQGTFIAFTPPSPVAAIGLLSGLDWHPLMRPG